MMLGQFDEFGKAMMRDDKGRENWENGRDEMVKFRSLDPANFKKMIVRAAADYPNFAVVGTTLQIVGEELCEALDVRSGSRVLDVAAGNGNVALAARRSQ